MFGEKIPEPLAQRWDPILINGLKIEEREKMLKDFKTPNNCKLLQAPALNPEIASAITEPIKNRDLKMTLQQKQLGAGITAINHALTGLLTGGEKTEAVRKLSDSCKILCDLHQQITTIRRKMITPGLDKSFNTIITTRDSTLFGSNLADQIRTSKTIEKQGLLLKKTIVPAKTINPPQTQRNYQGNWAPPPRYPYQQHLQPYQFNRGGRGGGAQRRMPPPAPRRMPAQTFQRPPTRNRPPTRPAQ